MCEPGLQHRLFLPPLHFDAPRVKSSAAMSVWAQSGFNHPSHRAGRWTVDGHDVVVFILCNFVPDISPLLCRSNRDRTRDHGLKRARSAPHHLLNSTLRLWCWSRDGRHWTHAVAQECKPSSIIKRTEPGRGATT